MTNAPIHDILTTLPNRHIVVLGDVMVDKFTHGTINRISPEAPIPVLSANHTDTMAGGAGNVVRNLCALGANSTLIGITGNDGGRDELLATLSPLKTATLHLPLAPDRPTTVKSRYVSGNQQILRVDSESTHPIPQDLEQELLSLYTQSLQNAHAVILSDYGKGVLTDTLIQNAITLATAKNIPILVDPKGTDYSKYNGATVLTPNRAELQSASGMPVQTDQHIIQACTHIMTTCGVGAVLATRSEQGMSWVSPDLSFHRPTVAQAVADVSGAGDTVIASLACGMACGADTDTTVAFANTTAGIVVSKAGTAVPTPSEITNTSTTLNPTGGKIMTLPTLSQQVEQWRTQGLSVGFTNGCFDILHTGHLSLVAQCKANCDRLILGLNSDDSVRRLGKGDDRPINPENSRATLLSALSHVDAVVIFDEDTPLTLIKTLKPDVLIKGADYTLNTVVGAEDVIAYGGRVVLADLVQGQSTTNTLSKIRQS